MAATLERLQTEVLALSREEQLFLARWLLNHAVDEPADTEPNEQAGATWLLVMAGRFSGGPGDTAERADEQLASQSLSCAQAGYKDFPLVLVYALRHYHDKFIVKPTLQQLLCRASCAFAQNC